jgi:hypothetical protein
MGESTRVPHSDVPHSGMARDAGSEKSLHDDLVPRLDSSPDDADELRGCVEPTHNGVHARIGLAWVLARKETRHVRANGQHLCNGEVMVMGVDVSDGDGCSRCE